MPRTSPRLSWLLLLAAIALVLPACGDGGADAPIEPGPWYEPEIGTPERIAYDMDVLRYLNAVEPSGTREVGNSTVYDFDQADGPSCMRGRPYAVSILDRGSEDLLFFMQGGGACWSDFCLAVTIAPGGVPQSVNLLNPTLEENPVKDWNVVYLPYCDGSLFVGDNIITEDDGRTRIHAGLHNTSAALSAAYKHYPAPRRIMLAGSSGGGYGTIMVAFIVRYIWPDTPIYIVNDSGVGIAYEGDRSFIDKLISEFNAEAFIPDDCEGCGDNGHITDLVDYFLERDKNTKVAVFTSWFDSIIADVFLGMGPEAYQGALERATGPLHEKHPDQYRRFIVNDITHTTILGNVTGIVGSDPVNGVELPPGMAGLMGDIKIGKLDTTAIGDLGIGEWIGYMLNDESKWVDITEDPDYENIP